MSYMRGYENYFAFGNDLSKAVVTFCFRAMMGLRSTQSLVSMLEMLLVDAEKCIGCKLCSWACAYGAREYDEMDGVMKKCTLCIDRIYNENLAISERQPACVITCPANARHFGDLGDPESAVSKLVEQRGGFPLMPETGYEPVNRYLPPRPRKTQAGDTGAPARLEAAEDAKTSSDFFSWLDKKLSR